MLSDEVLSCIRCSLRTTCRSPVPMQVGSTFFSWMIVGEAPGEDEDAQGMPFVGRSGELLDYALERAGFERSQFTITNSVKCRPPGNRTPTGEEQESCRYWLDRELEIQSPSLIVLLGKTAFMSFFPYLSGGFKHGTVLCQYFRRHLILYHPAYWLRNGGKVFVDEKVSPVIRSILG